jgi:hypothetical protein
MGFLKCTAVSKYFTIKFIKYSLFQNVRNGNVTIKNGNEISSLIFMDPWQFPLTLDYGRSPQAYINQRLQIQLELLMMNGMPLKTC